MRNIFSLLILVFFILACQQEYQSEWQQANCQLPTRWTEQVHPGDAWPEYPRPQMVRGEWQNQNGLWDYAIVQTTLERTLQFDRTCE